jgi:hypothetical protein
MTDKPTSPDPITNRANAAANEFADTTEHVALNADIEDVETIIRNMRFMAYGIGWEAGYRAAMEDLKTAGGA